MENDHLNSLIYKYLEKVTPEIAKKFKKEAGVKIQDPNEDQPSLSVIVKHFQESSKTPDLKRKCDEENDKSVSGSKRSKVVESIPDSYGHKSKSTKIERKKVFIRNIRKECLYEDIQETVEKYGEVTDFINSGRGFCFITFSSGAEAKKCVTALNNTELCGSVVQMNIARVESKGKDKGCKLFVHGVKQETVDEAINDAFAKYGEVIDVFNPGKGFAFVTLASEEEANKAVENLNGKELFGNTVSVNISKPKEKPETPSNSKKDGKSKKKKKESKEGIRLFVSNVDENTSKDDLKAAFEPHGTVTDVYNPGKGFAFVTLSTKDEAEKAIEALNGKEVCGKEIGCNVARFKKKVQKRKIRG